MGGVKYQYEARRMPAPCIISYQLCPLGLHYLLEIINKLQHDAMRFAIARRIAFVLIIRMNAITNFILSKIWGTP